MHLQSSEIASLHLKNDCLSRQIADLNERLHRMADDLERTVERLNALDHNLTLRLDRLSSENENLTNRIHDPIGFQQGYDKGYADCERDNQPSRNIECAYDAGREHGRKEGLEECKKCEAHSYEVGRQTGYEDGHREGYFRGREELMAEIHSLAEQPVEMVEPEPCCESEVKCCC